MVKKTFETASFNSTQAEQGNLSRLTTANYLESDTTNTNIQYNLLNLSHYSTAPVIGSAVAVSSLTVNKTTDYIGNMIYENGTLKRILIDGGYIEGEAYYYYLTDHQGNNRIVTNASATVIQKNHYYPFGMAFAETAVAEQGKQPYKYNNKELDQMNGLNQYDYSARYYDPAIARFTTPDPMAEKRPWESPYCAMGNNPVNRIDPTGMDWYWDNYDNKKKSSLQYDPEVKKDSQLKDGQKYAGETYQVKDDKGNVTEDYRKDGSIMYSSEASGYSRIWSNSQKTGNEEMGIITDKGVLVVPDYKNTPGEVNLSNYEYSVKDGNVVDAGGESFNTVATVHTHPNGTGPSLYYLNPDGSGGWGDLGLAANSTPNKPVFVLQNDGKNTISVIQSASANGMLTQGFNKYTVQNITVGMPNFNVKTIQTGGASLRQFTRQYSSYLRTFYGK